MRRLSLGMQTAIGVAAAILLTALSLVAVGSFSGWQDPFRSGTAPDVSCTVPNLPGAVVHVSLTNMGGPMLRRNNGMMSGGAMHLGLDQAAVSGAAVSFLVSNLGSVSHELVVLPLPDGQIAGTRPVGQDGRIDETGSFGEASNTCAEGSGQGILPGASGWVTMTLAPGRYELVCNLPGHYAAGMYGQFTVS